MFENCKKALEALNETQAKMSECSEFLEYLEKTLTRVINEGYRVGSVEIYGVPDNEKVHQKLTEAGLELAYNQSCWILSLGEGTNIMINYLDSALYTHIILNPFLDPIPKV